MPIEIKELNIRVNVGCNDNDSGPDPDEPENDQSSSAGNIDRVVEQCVEQVLEVIRKQDQR